MIGIAGNDPGERRYRTVRPLQQQATGCAGEGRPGAGGCGSGPTGRVRPAVGRPQWPPDPLCVRVVEGLRVHLDVRSTPRLVRSGSLAPAMRGGWSCASPSISCQAAWCQAGAGGDSQAGGGGCRAHGPGIPRPLRRLAVPAVGQRQGSDGCRVGRSPIPRVTIRKRRLCSNRCVSCSTLRPRERRGRSPITTSWRLPEGWVRR